MLKATESRELRAAVLAMKLADRDLRRKITARQRETMNPVWQRGIAENVTWNVQWNVLSAGARIAAGNPPYLVAANSKRPLGRNRTGRRLIPTTDWQGFEYGAPHDRFSRYERQYVGSTSAHHVERRTMRHLQPRRRGGHVLGPAVAALGPRMAALTVQSVVKTYMDILDQ